MSFERSTLTAEARAMMIAEPETCRYITLDSENREEFALAIKEGLRARKRTEIRLYAEMCKFVGTQVHQINALFVDLGVRDKSELTRALELVRGSSKLSLEECEQEAIALLRFVLIEKPERRAQILAAIGGRAIEAHGNGNGAHP